MKSLNTNIKQIFSRTLLVGLFIAGVSSCSVAQNTARETDGIYYDPSTEPVQEVVVVVEDIEQKTKEPVYQYKEPVKEQSIRIGGKYFDEEGNAPESADTETYEKSETYNDDRVVINNNSRYDTWGEDEGVEININNYYTGFSPSFYYGSYANPYRFRGWYGPSWGFGWNAGWGYNPYFTSNFGWGYPYYGFNNWYGPYRPYYYGYGYGYQPYYGGNPNYNDFYRNNYVRDVYRGKGNQNGVRRYHNSAERTRGRSSATNQSPQRRNVRVRSNRTRTSQRVVRTPRENTRQTSGVREPRTRSDNSFPTRRETRVRSVRRNNNSTYTPPRRTNNTYSTPRRRSSTRSNNSFSTPRRSTRSSGFNGNRSSSSSRGSSGSRGIRR